MSRYALYHGKLLYGTQLELENVVAYLRQKQWLTENNYWRAEVEKQATITEAVDLRRQTLTVPDVIYQNFHLLEERLLEKAVDGKLIGTTTDGDFCGWILTPWSSSRVNLKTWASNNGYDVLKYEDDEQAYFEWQMHIEDAFHAEHSVEMVSHSESAGDILSWQPNETQTVLSDWLANGSSGSQ